MAAPPLLPPMRMGMTTIVAAMEEKGEEGIVDIATTTVVTTVAAALMDTTIRATPRAITRPFRPNRCELLIRYSHLDWMRVDRVTSTRPMRYAKHYRMTMAFLFGIRIRLGPRVVRLAVAVVVVDLILLEEIEAALAERDVAAAVVGKDVDLDVDAVENDHLMNMDMIMHKCRERLSTPIHVHFPKVKYMI